MKISGAKAIVECLLEQGVDTVFGYPGGMILPLYDALHDTPGLKHVLTVHEQGAAHAADGYARASGKVGVCIATSGPGATNLVTGLATAYMDSVPVVAITGQVPTNVIGQDAFQEIDIVGMTMAVTKHNFQVKDVNKLPEIIRYAFRIARSGRPGPVLVDVPRNVQTAQIDFSNLPPKCDGEWHVGASTNSLIDEAAQAVKAARQPAIIIGGGVINAEAHVEIANLATRLQIPVVSTLMGLGGFPGSHPLFLGMTGLHGHKAANNAIHNADAILAIGCRFSDRVTGDREQYGAQKTVIHIDVDPAEIDKNVMAHIGIAGDLKQILIMLNERLDVQDYHDWWEMIRTWQADLEIELDESVMSAPLVMQNIVEQTKGLDTVFVTDVGQHQMWAAQYLKIEKPRTWLTSGGLGTMGFGLPAAMGAQFAMPHKKVIHIAGDGGMKMTGNELYTIAVNCLPIVSVIINNQGLGMIRQLQYAFYNKRYTACILPPEVDFTMYAKSFGIHGVKADTLDEFKAAFTAALASDKPEVIVVNIDSENLVTPMMLLGASLDDYVDL